MDSAVDNVCDGVGFCDGDGCEGCSATWTYFPINPTKSWNELTHDEQEYIRSIVYS